MRAENFEKTGILIAALMFTDLGAKDATLRSQRSVGTTWLCLKAKGNCRLVTAGYSQTKIATFNKNAE